MKKSSILFYFSFTRITLQNKRHLVALQAKEYFAWSISHYEGSSRMPPAEEVFVWKRSKCNRIISMKICHLFLPKKKPLKILLLIKSTYIKRSIVYAIIYLVQVSHLVSLFISLPWSVVNRSRTWSNFFEITWKLLSYNKLKFTFGVIEWCGCSKFSSKRISFLFHLCLNSRVILATSHTALFL